MNAKINCPKCGSPMTAKFDMISGNAKYKSWHCEVCEHVITKCLGIEK